MALPEDSASLLRLQEMEYLDRCDYIEFIFILQVPDIADRELCVWKADVLSIIFVSLRSHVPVILSNNPPL